MQNNYKKALDRIKNIHQNITKNNHIDHTGSWLLLFQEFNRRMSYWVNLIKNNTSGYGLWIDIANEINSDWNINNDIDSEYKAMMNGITKYASFFECYLNWEKHKQQIKKLGYDVSLEPYEPIILFFELGNPWIHNDGTGYYEVGKERIRRPKIEDYLNKPKLSTLNIEDISFADMEYEQNKDIFFKKYDLRVFPTV